MTSGGVIRISEILSGAWLERALYTAEERGIPSFADGLKPVQRFLVCKALKMARNKYEKVATIATIATEGYHHGEASAASALIGMAAEHSNNLPIFEGDGNFGNVLDPSPGAPRYIYAKLSPLFEYIFKDMELCPEHPDPDHIPPVYYLPIIPLVLVNGVKGIATGYATDVPPHCPVSVIDWLIERTKGNRGSDILPKYYGFTGTVVELPGSYRISGTYERNGETKIHITELPRGNTCLGYDSHLKKLQEKGIILGYENNSRMNRFDYIVTLKRGTNWTEEELRKTLKLDSSHTWNLTTVSLKGKIQEWDKLTGIMDIMESFYQFRLPFVEKRIQKCIDELENREQYLRAMISFCQDVVSKKFSFVGLTDADFRDRLETGYKVPKNYIESVMNMPVRGFTVQRIEKSKAELHDTRSKLDYYRNTTPEREYRFDLKELRKNFIDYKTEQETA